ncbi:MAG: PH domain-containing protein [bacterium]|nr:PH domain-containing protein [bacterium]
MKQLDPKAVWLLFLNNILGWTFLGTIFYIFIFIYLFEPPSPEDIFSLGFLNFLWVIIPTFLILCFLHAKLTYHFYRYELADAGFRKELGIIGKTYVTIPYDRIQNVDIYRSLLERILGLSNLNIQTAGMSGRVGAEGRLPGLSMEVAEQLRDELIQRARQSKSHGL